MDRRIAKTKNAIVSAYLQLTEVKDNRRITVTEIAKVADIDRKTFYLHYSQVDDILEEIIQTRIEKLDALLKENGYFEDPSNSFLITKSLNELIQSDYDLFVRMAKDCIFNAFWWKVESLLYNTILSEKKVEKEVENYKWIYARFSAAGNIAVYKAWLIDNHGITLDNMRDAHGVENFIKASKLFTHDQDFEKTIAESL